MDVRGRAVSLAVIVNFFFNTLMTLFFPYEINILGLTFTFILYAIVLVIGTYYVIYRRLTETKGLSLEQIERKFMIQAGLTTTAEQRIFSNRVSAVI